MMPVGRDFDVTVSHITIHNPPPNFDFVQFVTGRRSLASNARIIIQGDIPERVNNSNEDTHTPTVEQTTGSNEVPDAQPVIDAPAPSTSSAAVDAAAAAEEKVCGICRQTESDCKLSPCGHNFHKDCVRPWVIDNFTCCICQVAVGMHDVIML